jgi:hypothetical protein
MALKPWYDVVKPREDLREGKPLDASEFAVHLDQVRDGRAHDDYQKPERFFSKTVLTTNLIGLASEVARRLNGIKTQANAVFNLTTQFGGGKTHALTLLYHLAMGGNACKGWEGADKILVKAQVADVPTAAVAVFVGTEFDSLTGRGGDGGEPLRKTPWGELAWQLGGAEGFKAVENHEKQQIAPSSEVIRAFLPKDKPTLILLDELMNYVSRNRKSGLASQLYNFLQNLSEEARGQNNVVLCVSIPASELEMSAEDHTDYDRFKKLLDRLGKPVIMSSEAETSEIIRRRLFEWEPGGLSRDAEKTIAEYAEWVNEKRNQIPSWFPVDHAREAFRATYPFHPSVLSVFERKWQELPRFQQTRGVLKMLALWVSKAYSEGYKGNHRDPLIGLGTAPLEDSIFRTAVFEQIGESKLEGAVTTDICGKRDSHATRLDQEAAPDIKKARLHRKVMTTIFFESNGGQSKGEATEPEVRLAVGEPDWDIGHIDTVLETLNQACYYLNSERRRYRFSLSPNLNKLLADRRANVNPQKIDERVRAEIKKTFTKSENLDVVLFPEKSGNVTDRPALTLAVLPPDQTMDDAEATKKLVESMTRESGKSSRTYKTAIVWCVAGSAAKLKEEARKLLAWEDIQAEEDVLRLDDAQCAKLAENVDLARRSIKEAVWQAYNTIVVLAKDNQLKVVDMGLLHSSSADSLPGLILKHLMDAGDVEKGVSPNFLIRKWPGFVEWSTKSVRDAFYASPLFPRLLNAEGVKETIARGVTEGLLAYVGKKGHGRYEPFIFNKSMIASDVEISDEVYIVQADEAKKHVEPQKLTSIIIFPDRITIKPGDRISFRIDGRDQHARSMAIPGAKWTATGGTVEQNGAFTAGDTEGTFGVDIESGDVRATASLVINKRPDPHRNDLFDETKEDKSKTDGTVPSVQWSGQVPSSKWMTFYTKVLAKYAKEKGLTLKASFELRPEHGLTVQQVDEIRAALRELALNDDVEAK